MQYMYDAHCHIEQSHFSDNTSAKLHPDEKIVSNIMMTNTIDYEFCKSIPDTNSKNTLAFRNFGIHPWFCHLFSVQNSTSPIDKKTHYQSIINWGTKYATFQDFDALPQPTSIDEYIKENFTNPDSWIGIGEAGLDKLAICNEPFLKEKNIRVSVKMDHQIAILKKFLELSYTWKKPISLHCVKCPGVLHSELIQFIKQKKCASSDISIVLHSFTGSIDSMKLYLKSFPNCVVSVSKYIDIDQEKHHSMLKEIPLDKILIESDIDVVKQEHKRTQYNHLHEVLDFLAKIHNLPKDSVRAQVNKNFEKIYSLDAMHSNI
ncbi:hypothetical protein ACO0QE_003780 [Hanseniaspora vineae]